MKKSLLFLLLLLSSFAFTFAQTTEKTTEEGEKVEKGIFMWSEETYDFGDIDQGAPATHRFTFRNVGKGDLTIYQAKPGCGCTVANWSKEPIPPGGEGFVEAKYNSARGGHFNKGITVISDANPPSKALYLKGKVLKKENLDLSGGSMMDTQPKLRH